MDYEKAYKELVGKIEKAYLYAQTDSTKAVLEEIRPELKESMDERIRKSLINLFKIENFNGYVTLNGIDVDDVITWLEKQKTSEEAIKYLEENHSPSEISDFQAAINQEIKDWLEKQGESKLAGCEDDRIRKWLVDTIKQIPDSSIEWETISKSDVLAWLENQGKQKPAKWSEEDEKKRKCLIKGLEDRMGFGLASDPFSREEYINWLKSLRPKKQWKPSDEQMTALSNINVTGGVSYAGQGQELINLYNDLKKLMEDNYDKNV